MAAEAGISRKCLSKWYGRWQMFGEQGLLERHTLEVTQDQLDIFRDLYPDL